VRANRLPKFREKLVHELSAVVYDLNVIERVPITYDPQYWSLVFPLGMYTVATFVLANAAWIPFLLIIPRIFVYIAMLAWSITFGGTLFKLRNFWVSSRRSKTSLIRH
jgi:Voltage-dependent anion channel